jgi:hypothetical protein
MSLDGTIAGPGSEFRNHSRLATLLQHHPHWPLLEDFLSDGVHMLSTCDLSADPTRATENLAMIERGNHKNCENNLEMVRDQIAKDCKYGFAIPLPLKFHQEIPNAMIGAISLVCQMTTSNTGECIPKYRFAHDQMFTVLEEALSANDIAATNYQPAHVFGYFIPRFVNYILSLRKHHPDMPILINKVDWKSAYRRLTVTLEAAFRQLTVFDEKLYAMLRLTFGGTPNVAIWNVASETTCDLANDLLWSNWLPTMFCSPLADQLPAHVPIQASVPLKHVRNLATITSPDPRGRAEVFIDDMITAFIDTPENASRTPFAVTTAIHLMARPIDPYEPIAREDPVSIDKLLGGRSFRAMHSAGLAI